MKLEDEARYVLLPVIHQQAATSSLLSPSFSLPLDVVRRGTNQVDHFGSFFFPLSKRSGVIDASEGSDLEKMWPCRS